MSPQRIQRKRTKGWRMPEGAVYVGRPTRWGNPFKVGEPTHLWHRATTHPFDFYRDWFAVVTPAQATGLYRKVMTDPAAFWLDQPPTPEAWQVRLELMGRDLACWCPLDDGHGNRVPCHADVLLELANPGWTP